MRILLASCAGMSTIMLVEKMKDAARENNEEHTIWAIPVESIASEKDKCDVILLGPQVRLQKKAIEKVVTDKPVEVIPSMDYGRQNGKAVLEFAKSLQK